MIFIGDIAIPNGIKPNVPYLPESFLRSSVVANLEGAIAAPDMSSLSEMKLFSNDAVISFLTTCHVCAVSLANNHISDVSAAFSRTKSLLKENQIAFCGAGLTLAEAQAPAVIEENGRQAVLLAFGWDVISCKYAGHSKLGVNPLTEENIHICIAKAKQDFPEAQIVVLPHWDYELERYPMPMHRELAKLAIEAGADAVIGHHPHCVQGIEVYKGCPIIYSLGNWFIPDNVFMGGRTVFPQYAKLQMAVEITGQNISLHWFEYDANTHSLNFIGSEGLAESQKVPELTPFWGLSQAEYIAWFRKHRVKKRLLPLFMQSDASFDSKVKAIFVKHRQILINIAFRKQIINRHMKASHEKTC
ncbi:MAG: CapA family protein [Clostridiaceae bacterium]|nr:CapA family protein [Clostridiaceae bacterium]